MDKTHLSSGMVCSGLRVMKVRMLMMKIQMLIFCLEPHDMPFGKQCSNEDGGTLGTLTFDPSLDHVILREQ